MLPGDDIARVATKELMQREARQTLASVGGKGFSSFYKLKKHVGVAKRPDALHHIVEQHSDNIFRFGNEQIQNTKNVIKLPDSAGSIHKKITGFYNSIQPEITGSDALRVRDWVKNKSYVEQYNFGIDQIRRFGGEEYLINQGIGSIK